jgi:hypothetical protein
MDACSFDWELASKFIPLVTGIITIGVAGFVYYVWHKQKEKEVIANEAKDTILDMISIEKTNNKIANLLSTSNPNNEVIEKLIGEYSNQCNELNHKLDFIKEILNDDKNLENVFNKFERTRVGLIVRYTALLKNEKNNDRETILMLAQQGGRTHLEVSKEIKKILIDYVKYKKSI